MSGHSKFANIKHKKEKNDAAKGKIFTIIGREIAVAVKEGGPDPSNNFKLAQVIAKAKANNMPNDTIERIRPERHRRHRGRADGQPEQDGREREERLYKGAGKCGNARLRLFYV